ncbi:hypothetical protein ABE088_29015 [Priestia megaterium]
MIDINDDELKIIDQQNKILTNFILHYLSYKELYSKSEQLIGDKGFWKYSSDAHIMQCFNYWCMVFGSDKNNHTHWKRLSFNIDKGDGGFKVKLLNELKMNKSDWDSIWKDITSFRNKFTAHRDINYLKPVPYLDAAYKSVFIYDNWINEDILPFTDIDNLREPLEEFADDYKKKIRETVKQLLDIPTNSIPREGY